MSLCANRYPICDNRRRPLEATLHMSSIRRIGLAVDAVASYGRGIIRGIMSFCRLNPHWVITVEPQWSFGTLPRLGDWDADGLIVQTYSRDFEDEVPGYLNNGKIVAALERLSIAAGVSSIPDSMRQCYEVLVRSELVPKTEMELLDCWLADLHTLEPRSLAPSL